MNVKKLLTPVGSAAKAVTSQKGCTDELTLEQEQENIGCRMGRV